MAANVHEFFPSARDRDVCHVCKRHRDHRDHIWDRAAMERPKQSLGRFIAERTRPGDVSVRVWKRWKVRDEEWEFIASIGHPVGFEEATVEELMVLAVRALHQEATQP